MPDLRPEIEAIRSLRNAIYDGRGLDPASVRAGVGLSSMRERALEIGGEFKVESGPGQGTRVRVEFPL